MKDLRKTAGYLRWHLSTGTSVLDTTNLVGDWEEGSSTVCCSHAEGYWIRSLDGLLSCPVGIIPVNGEDPLSPAAKLYQTMDMTAGLCGVARIIIHVQVSDHASTNTVSSTAVSTNSVS